MTDLIEFLRRCWPWLISPIIWLLLLLAAGQLVRKSNAWTAKLCMGGAAIALVGEALFAGEFMHHIWDQYFRGYYLQQIYGIGKIAKYASAIGQATFAFGILMYALGMPMIRQNWESNREQGGGGNRGDG